MNWFKKKTIQKKESAFSRILHMMDDEHGGKKEFILHTKNKSIFLTKNHLVIYLKNREANQYIHILYSDIYYVDEITRYTFQKYKTPIIQIQAKNLDREYPFDMEFTVGNAKKRKAFFTAFMKCKLDYTQRLLDRTRALEEQEKEK